MVSGTIPRLQLPDDHGITQVVEEPLVPIPEHEEAYKEVYGQQEHLTEGLYGGVHEF